MSAECRIDCDAVELVAGVDGFCSTEHHSTCGAVWERYAVLYGIEEGDRPDQSRRAQPSASAASLDGPCE